MAQASNLRPKHRSLEALRALKSSSPYLEPPRIPRPLSLHSYHQGISIRIVPFNDDSECSTAPSMASGSDYSKHWPFPNEPGRPTVSRSPNAAMYQHNRGARSDEVGLITFFNRDSSENGANVTHDDAPDNAAANNSAQSEVPIGIAFSDVSSSSYTNYHYHVADMTTPVSRSSAAKGKGVSHEPAGEDASVSSVKLPERSAFQTQKLRDDNLAISGYAPEIEQPRNPLQQAPSRDAPTKKLTLVFNDKVEIDTPPIAHTKSDLFGDPGSSSSHRAPLFGDNDTRITHRAPLFDTGPSDELFVPVDLGTPLKHNETASSAPDAKFESAPIETDFHRLSGMSDQLTASPDLQPYVETHIANIRRRPAARLGPLPKIPVSHRVPKHVAELWPNLGRLHKAKVWSLVLIQLAALNFVSSTTVIVKTYVDKQEFGKLVIVWEVASTGLLVVAILMVAWSFWYKRRLGRETNVAEDWIEMVHPSRTKALPPIPGTEQNDKAHSAAGQAAVDDMTTPKGKEPVVAISNPYLSRIGSGQEGSKTTPKGKERASAVPNSASTNGLLRRSQESTTVFGAEDMVVEVGSSSLPISNTMASFMSELVAGYAEEYSPLADHHALPQGIPAGGQATPSRACGGGELLAPPPRAVTHHRGVPSTEIVAGRLANL